MDKCRNSEPLRTCGGQALRSLGKPLRPEEMLAEGEGNLGLKTSREASMYTENPLK